MTARVAGPGGLDATAGLAEDFHLSRARREFMLTVELMRQMWPQGNSKVPGLIEGIVASAPAVFTKYELNDDLVIAQAMAQFSHECGGGTEMVEKPELPGRSIAVAMADAFHAAAGATDGAQSAGHREPGL
jgi:hypothetical protein